MVSWNIRDAQPDDASALISMRKRVFSETDFMLYAADEYSATAEEVSAQLQRTCNSEHSRFLVAESAHGLIGFLGVSGSSVPRLRHSGYLALGVVHDFWGRGVGAGLLSEVIRWAPSAGLSRLELHVRSDNHRAIELYERLGFRKEGTRRRAYIVNGAPFDDHVMAYVYEA